MENYLAHQLRGQIIALVNKSDLSITLKHYILMDLANETAALVNKAVDLEVEQFNAALKEDDGGDANGT